MKVRNVKGMAFPALGIGAGMLASPKVAEVHPFLSKHPYLPPILLLLVALVLFSYNKARPFALGLGAVSLVFLVMAIWGKVRGVGAPAEEAGTYPELWPGVIAPSEKVPEYLWKYR